MIEAPAVSELGDRVERLRASLADSAGCERGAVSVAVAPYRVCPLGAHIDHQGGPVLGMAIDAYTLLAFTPAEDVRLTSENYPGEARFTTSGRNDAAGPDWGRYALGAFRALGEHLASEAAQDPADLGLSGLFGRLDGTLPECGLSSSASVLLAYLSAMSAVNGATLSPEELVACTRRAENVFVGLKSGILDPASIAGARRGHLLAIDTRNQCWEPVPAGAAADGYRFLVAFTGASRNLIDTGFNNRVEECFAAARRLGHSCGIESAEILSDLPPEILEERLGDLPEAERLRATHFRDESARVRRGIEWWRNGDLAALGREMNASCHSSIHNYQTGSEVLVELQEMLGETAGVLGSRFSGAGFGGCAIALVDGDAAEDARSTVARRFDERHPELSARSAFFLVQSEDGVRIV